MLFLRFFLFAFVTAVSIGPGSSTTYGWKQDSVDLKDIGALTFVEGAYTNARRVDPVPQLQCTGGCGGWLPRRVQCKNQGSDGNDVQWKCEADMPSEYKFGSIAVNCEGYDGRDDPRVLKGSCGLEYTLEKTGYYDSHRKSSDSYIYQPKSSRPSFGNVITIAGIILIGFIIFYKCINTNFGNTRHGNTTGQAPPPPGFRSDYYPSGTSSGGTYGSGCNDDYTYSRPRETGGAGGFWTGAATGGLLGYMMGRNNSDQTTYQRPTYHSGSSSFFGSGSSGYSSSEGSSTTHTSTGYGGTKRR